MIEYLSHPAEVAENLEAEVVGDLKRFFEFFKSYNPNRSMGPGMAAEFIMRRDSLEFKLDKLRNVGSM